ncbi:beta-ketoacyl synthase N-terminal-like domain-containing protein, partial [Vibrio parahaemolyticus]|nr:beta-ketoacyl synthase N-terminal-like domain-containing protein [Vibrio parahaemolyticus]
MPNRSPQPLYIQACGFHSAMGQDDAIIHQCLSGAKPSNMVVDQDILNSGRQTVIGRIAQPLPQLPSAFSRFDTRNNRLALSALQQIESDVHNAIAEYGRDRIAVVIGTSTSGISDGEIAFGEKLANGEFPADYHYTKQELGNCSDFITAYFDLSGPHYSVSTACSSSGRVFLTAQRLIRSGIVDAVIVGGVDTICRLTLNG